jgi:hypothetical protein
MHLRTLLKHIANAAFCVKDRNGKPASEPPKGGECGLAVDSLTRRFWEGHAQIALFALIPLLLPSCLSYREVVLQDVKNIQVERFDGSGLSMRVDAVIENPNNYRIRATDPDVDLYLNGKLIGKGILDSALSLDRRSTRTYSIPLRAEFSGGSLLMMLLGGALSGNMEFTAKGTVVGRAGLLRKRFPFELTEQLDLMGR